MHCLNLCYSVLTLENEDQTLWYKLRESWNM